MAAYSVGLGPYSLQTSVQMPEAGETQHKCTIDDLKVLLTLYYELGSSYNTRYADDALDKATVFDIC